MKKVYILLTYTGTVLSKVIRAYTSEEYAHVSISLDYNLTKLYSFGRLHPYNPFIGGFVHEKVNSGTFKRFKNTKAELYSLEISDFEYNKIKRVIKRINKNKARYHFNIIGLFLAGLNIRVRRRNHFYCAEFVKYLFETSGTDLLLPDVIKPNHFRHLEKSKLLYHGKLCDYPKMYDLVGCK